MEMVDCRVSSLAHPLGLTICFLFNIPFCSQGFTKIKAPKEVFDLLTEFWNHNRHLAKKEDWPTGLVDVSGGKAFFLGFDHFRDICLTVPFHLSFFPVMPNDLHNMNVSLNFNARYSTTQTIVMRHITIHTGLSFVSQVTPMSTIGSALLKLSL